MDYSPIISHYKWTKKALTFSFISQCQLPMVMTQRMLQLLHQSLPQCRA